jgi:death-on-curing protein
VSGIRYLTMDEALVLCQVLGDLAVRDMGLLDSALHRPRSGFGGHEVYPTIELKAAALLHSLAKNHALIDGNKRLAWMAADVFLARHGLTSSLSHDAAVALVLGVAGGRMEVEEIAESLAVVGDDPQ